MWGGRPRGCGGPSGHSRPGAALPPFCSVVMEPLGWEGRVRLRGCEALLACDPPVIRREGANGAWRETASRQQIPISSSGHPHFWAPPCRPVSDPVYRRGNKAPRRGRPGPWGMRRAAGPCVVGSQLLRRRPAHLPEPCSFSHLGWLPRPRPWRDSHPGCRQAFLCAVPPFRAGRRLTGPCSLGLQDQETQGHGALARPLDQATPECHIRKQKGAELDPNPGCHQ